MAKMLKDALKTIEKYKNITPHYGELLDILGEILILREEYRRKMKKVIFPIDEGLMEKKITGGLPLIDFSAGTFDLTEPRKYFTALLEIAEKRAPGETKEVLKMIQDGTFNFEKMISDSFNSIQDEEVTEDIDDDVIDLVDLFLEESLRPALEKVVEKYGKSLAKSGWAEGYCPICGKEPKIGEIREEEGRRFLFCTQCGFEWRFMRIKCPFCGNEEQQTLAYFSIEGEERYRVDVCNECKRYIKTVDFRETKEEADLDVEDIATLHLDMLANEEGYD
ncbi:MAG TPA: formate dehydrogenase accessory protein FdhE [Syntrophales bacterium]|jgi:FdhE protein